MYCGDRFYTPTTYVDKNVSNVTTTATATTSFDWGRWESYWAANDYYTTTSLPSVVRLRVNRAARWFDTFRCYKTLVVSMPEPLAAKPRRAQQRCSRLQKIRQKRRMFVQRLAWLRKRGIEGN